MTKEQANQYIPLLQAYAEGKTIQYLVSNGWMDWEDPSFRDGPESYRVKPGQEKFTIRVWVAPSIHGHLITENDMSKYAPDWRKATAVVTLD